MIDAVAPFVVGVITGAPIWVWGVLAALIFIGWRATRERDVSAMRYAILPVWGVMAVVTIAQSDPTAAIWAAFGAAYLFGAALGWRAQGGVILSVGAGRARLRGEWLTMVVLMVMFWLRFVRAAAEAVAPAAAAQPAVVIGFSLIGGVAAGVFMGRSVRTVQAVYAAQTRAS